MNNKYIKYQKIYDKSPIFFQNFMATAYGFKCKKKRYGKEYYKYLKFIDELETYSKEELQEFQYQELVKLLKHAVANSKFYRELYKDINIQDIKSVEDLSILPIVDKEMLRSNIDDVITISKKGSYVSHTGGTTGKSLMVYYRKSDIERRMAILDHFKMRNGFKNMKMKKATFDYKNLVPASQTRKVFWRYNAIAKQMVYSTAHINDENAPYYVKSLNKFKPDALDGFISGIYDIASYIDRYNIQLEFTPIGIFPTAETVTDKHRDVIERVFKCKVRDQYASSEGAPFVWECECGNYHYDITTGIIENIKGSNEILVTSFTTYGTPLIRYRIGDSIEFEDNDKMCNCGFNTPLVKAVYGRLTDYLYSTSGAKITVAHMAGTLINLPNSFMKIQFIQDTLKKVVVKVVVDDNFKEEHKEFLINELKHKLGSDMEMDIKIANDILVTKSGKYKMIINNAKLD